jgi:hypothetical protein
MARNKLEGETCGIHAAIGGGDKAQNGRAAPIWEDAG